MGIPFLKKGVYKKNIGLQYYKGRKEHILRFLRQWVMSKELQPVTYLTMNKYSTNIYVYQWKC